MINVLDFIPTSLHASIKARNCQSDLTEYFHQARDTANAQRGGEVLAPAGKYLVNLDWTVSQPGQWPCASLSGDGNGTVFDAFDKAKFCVQARLVGNIYPLQHIGRPKFSRFSIDGGNERQTLGLLDALPSGINIDHVYVINSAIGFYCSHSHYGLWNCPQATGCRVGYYFGQIKGAFPYAGLTIPGEWPGDVHAGNKLLLAPSARINDFGVVFDNVTPRGTPLIKLVQGTIESNKVGIFMPRHPDAATQLRGHQGAGVILDGVWFEGHTSGDVLLWGDQPVESGDIDIGYGRASIVNVGALWRVKQHAGADLSIDNVQINQSIIARFQAASPDGIDVDRARIDGASISAVIRRPKPIYPGVGKSASCIVPDKVALAPLASVMAEQFQGSWDDAIFQRFGPQTVVRNEFVGVEAPFASTVLQMAPNLNNGVTITAPEATEPDAVYVLAMIARAPAGATEWQIGNKPNPFASAWVSIVDDRWRVYAVIWQPDTAADSALLLSRDPTPTPTQFAAMALMRFASKEAAADWCAGSAWPA